MHGLVSSLGRANERDGYIRTRGYKKKSVRLRLVYFNQDPLALPLFFLYLRLIFSSSLLRLLRPKKLIKKKRKRKRRRKKESEKKDAELTGSGGKS